MAQACNDCHKLIESQLAETSGFHGNLPAEQRADCGHCHLEHLGIEFPLVDKRAFQKAGWEDQTQYAHEKLGYELEGIHLELACVDCHKLAEVVTLEAGEGRFIGLEQSCTPCHEDPHEGKAPDCNACHGQKEKFEAVALFEHDKRFPLTGGHAGVSCNDCHEDGEYSAQRDPQSVTEQIPVRNCAACHQSPHNSEFLTAIARERTKTAEQTCALCHAIDDPSLAEPQLDKTLALHDLTGFALVKPHAELSCAACHREATDNPDRREDYQDRFPGRNADTCETCHGDPHEGQFVGLQLDASKRSVSKRSGSQRSGSKRSGSGRAVPGQETKPSPSQPACISCHQNTDWKRHSFTLSAHAKTEFALHGAHEFVACEKCHKTRKGEVDAQRYPEVRQFADTTTACKDCHETPHEGHFIGGYFQADRCLDCHGDDAFTPARFTTEMHAKTQFPIRGAHLAVACKDCHLQKKDIKQLSTTIADRIFHGTKGECTACHLDVHDGAFDRRGIPTKVGDRTSCQRCHNQDSFAFADRRSFRHASWTGFKLQGKHARIDCARCHPPGKLTHANTRSMGKAKSDCADCHADPHAGQFAKHGKTDCGQCHVASETDWSAKRFSHNKHARFALDKDHRDLACSACHKSYRLNRGGSIIRYQPLGITCKDCHGWEDKR